MKRRIGKWDEWDVVNKYWRQRLTCFNHAGKTDRIKRRMRRRDRHDANQEVRRGDQHHDR